jgi:signal transduction histidine kinase/ligand-binding sensor domain-containing protein
MFVRIRFSAVAALLLHCPIVVALDASVHVGQYAHTSWKYRDGFAKGVIEAIVQTPDGYLWLGTHFGLFRFDGVRAVAWQPPRDQHLPSDQINKLLIASDGTLWIGTMKGLASWKEGKLTQYPELAGLLIGALLEDHEGTVWVSGFAYNPPGKLCAIRNGNLHCYGEDGTLGNGAVGMYEDHKGSLWAGTLNGVWHWRPGAPKFYRLAGEPNGIQALAEDADGALLIGMGGKIVKFVEGRIETAYPLPGITQQSHCWRLLRDRDGALWAATLEHGLVHQHRGTIEAFARSDGLSGDTVGSILEDREGTIWVATNGGLDRFRSFAAQTYSAAQGLPSTPNGSVLAAHDGSVWVSARDVLSRWNNGRITAYRGARADNPPDKPRSVRDVIVSGLPRHEFVSLFEDDGKIWLAANEGIGYLKDGQFTSLMKIPGGIVNWVTGDQQGNIWIAHLDRGLIHLIRGAVVKQVPWSNLGHKDHAAALASHSLQGGVWLGFFDGGIAYFDGHRIEQEYTSADGLGDGTVTALQFDHEGALWAATEGGLSRLKNGRITTLTRKDGLPCDAVQWVLEDNSESLWAYLSCGLVRIERRALEAWASDADSNHKVQIAVFDSFDGVQSEIPTIGNGSPRATQSLDGKLWFTTPEGVSVIDPRHLPFNKLRPPVHIEQITADRKIYWGNLTGDASSSHPRLPPLIRDLTIDYTALSLAAPEKVRFRFKLEGQDRDWREVVNVRQVQYSNLAPGSYRFRVTACNNSGVWNEQGAALDFSIAPAYWQTNWFRALCLAALLALLWAFYQLRVRQLRREFGLTLEARVDERTRIARDLHDTLLQSFQGLLMRFQTAYDLLQTRPTEARQTLGSAIDQAIEAISEGRDAVQGLRSSASESNDLALAIETFGEELASEEAGHGSAALKVVVEGTPRAMHPILRDEIYRIASEALCNAFRHARATQIEVELRYGNEQLRLRVRDDGKGMDPELLTGAGREGHFGLPGMRERAKLIGGKLAVWSALDSGTEVELSIPASHAYAASSSPRRSWFAGKFSTKSTSVQTPS